MMGDRIKRLLVETPQGPSGYLNKESRYSFNYATTKREREVSLVMPLRAESYASGALFSVFEMNRPEGYLLDALRKRFAKIKVLDDMDLLAITGTNQIGRLSYIAEGQPQRVRKAEVTKDELIASRASVELFDFLVDTCFDSGISGFQPKVIAPVQVTEKTTSRTSDFIVKSAGEDYPHLAQNEFLCMSVAREAGIETPPFWLSDDGGLFIMSRFDIVDERRLGVEDMAVLMKRSPEQKYNGSYEMIARALDVFCPQTAATQKQKLFEYVALSCLVRNGDAHLKNFSLIYEAPASGARLSPLYDVVTTTVYEIVHPRTGATHTDRTLALNLRKSKTFPTFDELANFGSGVCGVRDSIGVIDRIEDAKRSVLDAQRDRIHPWLLSSIEREWCVSVPGLHVGTRKSSQLVTEPRPTGTSREITTDPDDQT
ncbi:MAG: type II toxin-antitoxin system HipA family toxin [Betaproteobacteria bacterium]|nr:type II toxin-antitoxin system HipA family toxin [Betaproteobacteria bacterium]